MFRFRNAIAIACLACSAFAIRADDSPQLPKAKTYPQWQGEWVLSEKFNRILGFTEEGRGVESIVGAPPLSFKVSLAARVGEGMEANLLKVYRDTVFTRLGHKIVATGKWDKTFRDNPGDSIQASCFITEHEGATFLWVPANYVVIYGGKLSYLEGAKPNHDVLVIDFNNDTNHLAGLSRSLDTFAFERKSK
jgi:hypothetical protein